LPPWLPIKAQTAQRRCCDSARLSGALMASLTLYQGKRAPHLCKASRSLHDRRCVPEPGIADNLVLAAVWIIDAGQMIGPAQGCTLQTLLTGEEL